MQIKRKAIVFAIFFLLIYFPTASAEKEVMYVMAIDGIIDAGTQQYVKSVIDEANEKNARLVVIKLNTNGGLLKATQEIVGSIIGSKTNVAVWVYKPGGYAFSAGTYILLASDHALAHPDATIGSAQPRPPDPKTISAMASWIKSLAARYGRNETAASKFVTENLALSGKEALNYKVIDHTASSIHDLQSKLGLKLIIERKEKPIQNKIFSLLSHPHFLSLLFLIGILGIIYTIKTGELEFLPIPIAFLLIFFWSSGTITFSMLGIALLLISAILFFLEFAHPGISIFGVSGGISAILGILTIEAEPFFAFQIFSAITMFAIGASLAGVGFFLFVGRAVTLTLRKKTVTGKEVLYGKEAIVVKKLIPGKRGIVKINDEKWSAFCDEKVDKKNKVKIVNIKGNTLYVRKI